MHELRYVVVVRERGQDQQRVLNRLWTNLTAAQVVARNKRMAGYNSAFAREATPDELETIGQG